MQTNFVCRVFASARLVKKLANTLKLSPLGRFLTIWRTLPPPVPSSESSFSRWWSSKFCSLSCLTLLPCLSGSKKLRLIWLSDLVSLCLQLVHRPKLAILNHFLWGKKDQLWSDVKFKVNSQPWNFLSFLIIYNLQAYPPVELQMYLSVLCISTRLAIVTNMA